MSEHVEGCPAALERVKRGELRDGDAAGVLECFRDGGLEMAELLALTKSNQDAVAALGVWIAAELPECARALFADLHPLTKHASAAVRVQMLDVLAHEASTGNDVKLDAELLDAVRDSDVTVRCRAIELVARWRDDRLGQAAATRHSEEDTEMMALVHAVRSRMAFESIAIKHLRSKHPRVAEAARVFLGELE